MGKVVRETVQQVIAEITRQTVVEDEIQPPPAVALGDVVANSVMLRLDRDLGGVLAEIRTGLARIEELSRAEAERRERIQVPVPLGAALGWDSMVATLSHHLPAEVSTLDGFQVAQFLASHLAEAGYALVPISGEALAAGHLVRERDRSFTTVRGPDGNAVYGVTSAVE